MGVTFSNQMEVLVQVGTSGNVFTSDHLMKQATHTQQCILVMQLIHTIQLDLWTSCSHRLSQHFLPSPLDCPYSPTVETQDGEVEFKVGEKFTRYLGSEDSP